MTDIQNNLTGRACDASPAARSCQSQCKPRFLTGRTCEHANRGCSHVRGESCHRLRKRVLNRRILSLGAERGQPRSSPAGYFVLFGRKKVPKNSPADAFAYFVPSNVRNGRLFAGLQANRPRFLPLLAGPSFHGSGIGPGSFAAKGGAGVRRLFYGCLHRTGSQYPAVAPESGFKPLYAFCRAGFSSRDIGKLSTFHF